MNAAQIGTRCGDKKTDALTYSVLSDNWYVIVLPPVEEEIRRWPRSSRRHQSPSTGDQRGSPDPGPANLPHRASRNLRPRMRCDTRRGLDQNGGFEERLANVHGAVDSIEVARAMRPPGRHTFVAGRSEGPYRLARRRGLMTLRNGGDARAQRRDHRAEATRMQLGAGPTAGVDVKRTFPIAKEDAGVGAKQPLSG